MQTREDFYAIEDRIDLRGRMFYITYPYTSLRQDALLLGADVAEATQEYVARQAVERARTERLSPLAQSPTKIKMQGEVSSGYGAEYVPPEPTTPSLAAPEKVVGRIVAIHS